MRSAIRRGLAKVGLEERAVALRRVAEPAQVTRDRRDHEHLLVVLAAVLSADANAIDVGAHAGDVLEPMARCAPGGHHLAFEPLPHLHAALRARVPQADVRGVALGAQPGPAPFVHVVTRPGWSGLRERRYPADETLERLTVDVRRLDDELPAGYVPALIKIDVEGAELGVLQGARRTLADHRPVLVFEHGLGAADVFGTRPQDVHDLLTGLGYRIYDLDGDGPLDRAAFTHTFATARRVNFLARP